MYYTCICPPAPTPVATPARERYFCLILCTCLGKFDLLSCVSRFDSRESMSIISNNQLYRDVTPGWHGPQKGRCKYSFVNLFITCCSGKILQTSSAVNRLAYAAVQMTSKDRHRSINIQQDKLYVWSILRTQAAYEMRPRREVQP
jgi:hypothetical protein